MPKFKLKLWSGNVDKEMATQWLHNPVILALIPQSVEDRKAPLKPRFDPQLCHPSWFIKPIKRVSFDFVVEIVTLKY